MQSMPGETRWDQPGALPVRARSSEAEFRGGEPTDGLMPWQTLLIANKHESCPAAWLIVGRNDATGGLP